MVKLTIIRNGDTEKDFRMLNFELGDDAVYVSYSIGVKGEGIKKKKTFKLTVGEVLELKKLLEIFEKHYTEKVENKLKEITQKQKNNQKQESKNVEKENFEL